MKNIYELTRDNRKELISYMNIVKNYSVAFCTRETVDESNCPYVYRISSGGKIEFYAVGEARYNPKRNEFIFKCYTDDEERSVRTLNENELALCSENFVFCQMYLHI